MDYITYMYTWSMSVLSCAHYTVAWGVRGDSQCMQLILRQHSLSTPLATQIMSFDLESSGKLTLYSTILRDCSFVVHFCPRMQVWANFELLRNY